MSRLKVHKVNFFEPKPNAIQSLAYDETSSQLAVSRSDSSIEIWNLTHKPYLHKIITGRCSISVETIAWSNGRLFSAGLHGYIIEHDLVTLAEKRTIAVTSNGGIWCLGVNKQNKYIAAGTEDGRICMYGIAKDMFNFEKTFSRQEGRIMCLDWHVSGDIIVTGSIDAIRIWNVKTGQIVERMVVSRSERNQETIVWCIAITRDMTIISGDSRGKTSFWNGKMAVLIESFITHKADVLSLCVNKEEDVVYSAGVDPLIQVYARSQIHSHGDRKTKDVWMRSVQRSVHTHDVRALKFTGEYLVSGGVDANLIFSKYPPKTVLSFSPLSQMSYLSVANERSCMLLKYPNQLELWRLGKSTANTGIDGEQLSVDVAPLKMLLLKAKEDESIICSTISRTGSWIAYSSLLRLRVFFLQERTTSEGPTIQKAKSLPKELEAGICMSSTSSGNLVAATALGNIQIMSINGESLDVQLSATIKSKMEHISLLDVSENDSFLAVAAKTSVHIYNLATNELHCRLPNYKCQVTAIKLDRNSTYLVAAYCDRKIVEYDVENRGYSDWCRRQNFTTFQNCSPYVIKGITFVDKDQNSVILYDEESIYTFDKFSYEEEPDRKRVKSLDVSQMESETSFKIVKKYKYLLDFCHIQNDEVIALEVKPFDILCSLPPPLRRKKYGT